MTERNESRRELFEELERAKRRMAELEAALHEGDPDRDAHSGRRLPDSGPPAYLNRLTDVNVLFEYVPIPLWYNDSSLVEKYLRDLQDEGVVDFEEYFRTNPRSLALCREKLRLIDVNPAALALFKASERQVFFDNYPKIFLKIR